MVRHPHYKVRNRQTDRAITRGPGGPKNYQLSIVKPQNCFKNTSTFSL